MTVSNNNVARRSQRRPRSGFVLVMAAIIMVVFLAIMALVLDMGFVMLSRRQMQASVNVAALEGLRFRDGILQGWQPTEDPPPGLIAAYEAAGFAAPTSANDPQFNDFARRWSASNLASQVLYTPDRQRSLARAIKVNLTANPNGPVPPFLQQIDPANPYDDYPPSPTERPLLQPNMSDAADGDLVAGDYQEDDAIRTANPDLAEQYFHLETHAGDAPYSRPDFGADSSGAAFLARMRRTGEGFDGSDQSRTSGGQLTSLFSGQSAKRADTGGSLQISVRATAVANAKPVKSVGPAFYHVDVTTNHALWTLGAAPLSIDNATWQSSLSAQTQAYLQGNGQVTSDMAGTNVLFTISGITQLTADNGDAVAVQSSAGFPTAPFWVRFDGELLHVSAVSGDGNTWTIDQRVTVGESANHFGLTPAPTVSLYASASIGAAVSVPTSSSLPTIELPTLSAAGQHALVAYAPISASIGSVRRVIGFRALTLTVSSTDPTATETLPNGITRVASTATFPVQITLTPSPFTIAPENGSAMFPSALVGSALSATDLAALLTQHNSMTNPLMAPALVRAVSLPPPLTFISP